MAVQILFYLYIMFMIIVMMNLLIAVISTAHADVAVELKKEIAHAATALALELQDNINDSRLPAPLNLLQLICPDRKVMAQFVVRASRWPGNHLKNSSPLPVLLRRIHDGRAAAPKQ